jgi:hypothetical protein
MTEQVCFTIDDYIIQRDKSHWFADLSDRTRVFADDERPGLEPIAWKRLRTYLYQNNLYITQLFIRFRSHSELIGSSDVGYMFRRGLMADVASGVNSQRFIVGLINNDDKIITQTWTVPELVRFESEDDIREIEGHEDSIIWNSPTSRVTNVVKLNI